MADMKIVIGATEEVTSAVNRAKAALGGLGSAAKDAGDSSGGAAKKGELAWLKKGAGVGIAIMAMKEAIKYANMAGEANAEIGKSMAAFNKVVEDVKVNVGAFVAGAGMALIAAFSLIGAAINGVVWAGAAFLEFVMSCYSWVPGLSLLLKPLESFFGGVADNSAKAANAGLDYAISMDKSAKAALGQIGSLHALTGEEKKIDEDKKKRMTAAEKEAERFAEAEKKRQEDIEGTIFKTAIATAKIGASEEELINIALVEAKAWEWNSGQVERYTASLTDAADKTATLAAAKEAASAAEKAQEQLAGLGKAPEVMMGGPAMDQFGEASQMQLRLDAISAHYQAEYELKAMQGASLAELDAIQTAAEVANAQQTSAMKVSIAASTAGMMAGIMQNLFTLTGSKSKALFESQKLFAIGQALIAAKTAVVGAYKSGAIIGGPVLGAAYAVAAGLATAAQVMQIKNQKMGGGEVGGMGGGGGGEVGGMGGGSMGAYPVPTREEAKPTQDVTINIQSATGDLSEKALSEAAESIFSLLNIKGSKAGLRINADVLSTARA